MSRTRMLLPTCPRGHQMKGRNLIWHKRYDKATGEPLPLARECRACAYERLKTKRQAERRNQELARIAAGSPAI